MFVIMSPMLTYLTVCINSSLPLRVNSQSRRETQGSTGRFDGQSCLHKTYDRN